MSRRGSRGTAAGTGTQRPGGRTPLGLTLVLAWRNAIRSRGRSLLILAMVAVPIAGLSAAIVVASSAQPTVAERLAYELGQTEAMLRVASPPDEFLRQGVDGLMSNTEYDQHGTPKGIEPDAEPVDPRTLTDARILTLRDTTITVDSVNGIATLPAVQGGAADPAFTGRFDLIEGERPNGSDEVLVTAAALERIGVTVGGEISALGPEPRSLRIVGVLRDAQRGTDAAVVYGVDGAFDGQTAADALLETTFFVADEPVSWAEVRRFNANGVLVTSRSVALGPAPADALPGYGGIGSREGIIISAAVLAVFAMFEVVLLAGAAFMVGARQQQRSLAVLASVGGDRRVLTRVVSAGGLVLGAVGGLVGIGLGIGVAAAYMAVTSDGSATMYPGFHLDPVLLGVVLVFAVLAAWLAALVPARVASKLDIVPALRGARRPVTPRRRSMVAGLLIAAAGFTTTVGGGALLIAARAGDQYNETLGGIGTGLVAAGPILMQLGVILTVPAILRWVSRLLAHGSTAARLASRDGARNTGRSVPVIAVIMSTVFVASFLMTLFSQVQLDSEQRYTYQAPMNTVTVSARGFEPGTQRVQPVDDPEFLAAEVDRILDPKRLALVGGVREFMWMGAGETADDALYPIPAVDPDQLCPADPRAGLPVEEQMAFNLRSDARCTDPLGYLSMSGMFNFDHIRVGTIDELELVVGERLSDHARQVLRDGGAVTLYPEYVRNGRVTVEFWTADQAQNGDPFSRESEPVREADVPGAFEQIDPRVYAGVLMLPPTAVTLGLPYEPASIVAQLSTAPSDAQRDQLLELSMRITGEPQGLQTHIETGPTDSFSLLIWALLAGNAIIALGAASIAIGLARVDGRRDEAILGAMGATPRLRRAVSFWQAIVLAAIGSVVGVLLGTVPALAFALPGGSLPFAPPWLPLAIAAFGVPLLIALGSWLLTRRARALPTDRTAIA